MTKGIPYFCINENWDQIEPLLTKAEKYLPDYTTESIKQLLLDRKLQLWVYKDYQGIALTEIFITPKNKICSLFLIVGIRFNEWQQELSIIEDWARSQGCSKMKWEGRKGWERKMKDYNVTRIVMEKTL